ncbi:putative triacylglycerol lipase [Helianthus annuus]|uniref:Putative alpha/beta-Hydrolases superfamily protein n=1 Tax=Helianthus annuus TaxID=4232 RepID=A0A251U1D0_HELAN|nr:triacylglycerol lipase OBL1 [Helianthus annuus]KAF5793491.1 putative triacylglycerol lipase [Helianthus annuus]KAJ0528324.1 putative triacylglycerol lipase [Helianthus annuus]KAJ0537256.1 putative triacylglycerol lipase [Helianthus annuus]KAJ0544753.1 putative triacylglycerol lipase [Helianthus annuus]KAJ0895774.1 putative triacylglycerol lipase [Helianthus annuus]
MVSLSDEMGERYLIVQPANGGITDLVRYGIFNNKASGSKFLLQQQQQQEDDDDDKNKRFVIIVSIIMRKLIKVLGKPMEWAGYVVDFILNLLSLNGGLLPLFANLFQGKMVIPERGTATFISTIGHIDGRINLEAEQRGIELEPGSRSLMDLCMMASKLAYENAAVINNVVNLHWKMHFVDFYNCWNEYQKERSTQVFIFCDKPRDANLIVISFRGTEPFDADDWITDFDYSWFEIPNIGKVHMGFLEAMGLGNRSNVSSFQELLQATNTDVFPAMVETSAYFVVRSKLRNLLEEHRNAKFMVTGHSLGGALAILFPTVLLFHEEELVLQRLLGVHTFGQPRVGNRELGRYVESKLQQPTPRYYRMVYCNDLVPRLPYDDKTFLYKHFGVCLYYDSFFVQQKVDEEPNPNYFGLWYLIPEYLNAVWELARGVVMGMAYGKEYKESWEGIMTRIIGLAIPGLSAHAPPNYVNSIRLGT